MSIAVCTLFEGDYHLGAGALINSLYQNGFRGIVFAGIRGTLPLWAKVTRSAEGYEEFTVAEGLIIRFLQLDAPIHLANYKPDFMSQVFENYLGPEEGLCYFDPDIVVKAPWRFFEDWIQGGVMLVEDVNFAYMPVNHPLRAGWMRVAGAIGFPQKRVLDRYYNSGFIGTLARYREALDVWKQLMVGAGKFGYSREEFTNTDRTTLWQAADQDHLNAMLMVTDMPLTTVGPDGMDFVGAGYIMSHAINSPKPWAKDFAKRALQGIQPAPWDRLYWDYVSEPIRLFDAATLRRKRINLKIGLAVGRFLKRPRA